MSKFGNIRDRYEAITNTLRDLRVVSKFKEVEEFQRKNNVVRADIKVSKYVAARLVVDLRQTVPDLILVGYIWQGKFKPLNHIKFSLTGDTKKDAKQMEKALYGLYQGYHHRIEKAFLKAGIVNG